MLHPKASVGTVLRLALRYPDGIASYAISAFSIGLLVFAWLARSIFKQSALLERVREGTLFMLLVPVAMLVSYVWLNDVLTDSKAKRWRNAAMTFVLAGVLLKRVLFG